MSSNFGPESDVTAPPAPVPLTQDLFIQKLGNPGRYQIVVMLLLSTNYIPVVINHILMAFYSASAPHTCKVPDNANKELYIPLVNSSDSTSLDSCSIYLDPGDHSKGTTPCQDGYEFEFGFPNEWTILAEWSLVCHRAFLAPLITTTYFCGVMIGGVIFGSLSDRFGRKSMMLICLYTQCMIGIGIHFVRGLVLFIGLRFIQGIFIQGLQCVTYSMVMELMPAGWRTLAGCVVEAFWAGGIVLLAVIARYVQHWRYIQLAINIPTVATVFYIWIIPESLRWLISKGKFEKAESIVTSILGYNSLDLDLAVLRGEMETLGAKPNPIYQSAGGECEERPPITREKRNPNLSDIFRIPAIRLQAFVLFFIWFSVSLCYYGITYFIPNMAGDKYLNFMLGGGIELAAYLLAFVVLGGWGRQGPLVVYLALSGSICIAIVSVRTFVDESVIDVAGAVIALALIGKACIVSCFCTIFIYSSEIFPTVIRTVGVGSCTFFGRVGSLLAPQVLLAGKYMYAETPVLVPFLLFGSLCLISALLTLLLPETMDRDLPDTLQQAVNQGHKQQSGRTNSLDIGYGKCPEFVCVDGLIVSRESGESGEWREDNVNTDTEQSFVSTQGTLTTLRSRRSSPTEPDYEIIPENQQSLQSDSQLSHILRNNAELLSSSRDLLSLHSQTSSRPTFSAKQDLMDTLNPSSLPRSSSSDLLNQPNRFSSREVLDLPRSLSREVLDLPRSSNREVLNLPRSSSRDGLDLPRQSTSSNRNPVNLPRSRDQSNYLPARQSQVDLVVAQRSGSVDLLSRSSDDLLLDLPPRAPPVPAPRRLEPDRLRAGVGDDSDYPRQDASVVSAESSLVYLPSIMQPSASNQPNSVQAGNQTKDDHRVNQILKQKLLALDNNETRL